jgi:alkylation response protein AidB-like acyl-CoA dehydrogenase/DNA-binding CsgD family transcriptional regulator
MLAVHSAIGAVSTLVAFGTPSQQARHLPGLAAGRPLSVFGATEPEVGCDLGAVRTTLARRDGRLVIDGTKMFITNATYGRLVKLLVVADGKPAVVLARLPDRDTPSFRLLSYALHPLRHTSNHALEFRGFTVDEQDVINGPGGDAMAVVWHGLNRGRSTLAAQAAGTLGLLRAHAREHALRRASWGQPIASRQLVQGRLARIAAGSLACEALSTWAAATIDSSGGMGGELEAITAKVVASQAVREGAIDALGIHGGRAFLVGHPLGDSFHDHLAVGTVMDDLREAAHAEGSYSVSSDAHPLRISLNPSEGLGALDNEVRAEPSGPTLSAREREVLAMIAEGGSIPMIAKRLFLAPSTVKTHVQRLYEKLGVGDRAAAVAEAMRRGLLD